MEGRDREVLWGENIRQARQAAGLSQVELAGRLGVVQGTISRWEAGDLVPRDRHRIRLARVFDIPVSDLFPLEGW